MARPNTKVPTDETVKKDFQDGTVQPGPGMAPEQPPAEDMKGPNASEEFQGPKSANKKEQSKQQNSSCGSCGCH
jgi:hypothetical protein